MIDNCPIMKTPTYFKVAYTEEDPNSSGMPSIKKKCKALYSNSSQFKIPKVGKYIPSWKVRPGTEKKPHTIALVKP